MGSFRACSGRCETTRSQGGEKKPLMWKPRKCTGEAPWEALCPRVPQRLCPPIGCPARGPKQRVLSSPELTKSEEVHGHVAGCDHTNPSRRGTDRL